MKKFLVAVALVASFFLAQNAMATTELVTNGGFETGDFSGWTMIDTSNDSWVDTYLPHSPLHEATLGPYNTTGSLSQTLTTSPGQSYNLQFWLANDSGPAGDLVNSFAVQWGGTPLTRVTPVFPLGNAGIFGYTAFNFTVVAPTASTELEFITRNDVGYFYLDDVSVKAVPIPGTVVLLGSGLLSLLGWRRLRKS